MLHSGMIRCTSSTNPSSVTKMPGGVPCAKPYAVMEFEGLLATALSSQSLETLKNPSGGLQQNQQMQHSVAPAVPSVPPSDKYNHWERMQNKGPFLAEGKASSHHIPKPVSEIGHVRQAYLDVTQTQDSHEDFTDSRISKNSRQKQQQQRLHQASPLRLDTTHVHAGFSRPVNLPPNSPTSKTALLTSIVTESSLVSPHFAQHHTPPIHFRLDASPRQPVRHQLHREFSSNLPPGNQGHTPESPSTEQSRVNGLVHFWNRNGAHVPPIPSINSIISHTPLNNSFSEGLSLLKSPRAIEGPPCSVRTPGSSSSGSLFSSPPSHSYNSNNTTVFNSGPNGPVSYFAHSPLLDTGSGNTSMTLSDGPVPIADLQQKPGPNLIKPIAFKPTNGNSPNHSPSSNVLQRQSETDGKGLGHPIPRGHPPSHSQLSSKAHTSKPGTSLHGAEPLSPSDPNKRGNIPSGGTGAFGKVDDTGIPNDARSTSFVEQACPPPNNTTSPTSPRSGHALPAHTSFPSAPQTDNNNSIYKNITPITAAAYHGQQHHGEDEVNTSYSSFTGEFPHSDAVCAPQSLSTAYPVHTNKPHQPYPGIQQQQQQQHRGAAGAGETSMLQTPSPSDSGVGEHEAILREKDAEINTLREVMDRNERAIFQVYEERRHVWLNDTRKLQDDYERKLKVQSRKSYKTEQVLSLQVYKLQQEQKTLQEEKVKVTQERDALKQRLDEEKDQVVKLRRQLCMTSPPLQPAELTKGSCDSSQEKAESAPAVQASPTSTGNQPHSPHSAGEQGENSSDNSEQELQRELISKNKELIQLRSKLANFEADLNKANKDLSEKARELASCNDKVKSLQEDLMRAKNPPQLADTASQTHAAASQVVTNENLLRPSLLGKQERTIEELQEESLALRAHIEELKVQQEEERKQWLDEKNKVVRYQKQLQLNYVQMQRKNNTLETEVQQLTLELENRDMKLTALNGEESVC
ncbi:leucine zipper putative tumor suppressor 2-like protein [Plakobranchus ocellatus]|uniref:Leucine zipper putative tumor suppressor 2-like protein n=1 Tax=Plakobranchus ocellatus TaxID=259542 RepID=A0AAV3XX56_9GAST|nr:leucine zipper putative tumor suppressor 2-like protein [Plakobranchus ocellatus]